MNFTLNNLLNYVYKENIYYKSVINITPTNDDIDISLFPLLTREKIQTESQRLFSNSTSKNLKRTNTSGSSGIPVSVCWSYDSYIHSMLTLWNRRKKYYGITVLSKKVDFTLSNSTISSNLISYNNNNTIMYVDVLKITSPRAWLEIYEKLYNFEPDWLYIQPSVLLKMVMFFKENNLNSPYEIKYIETVGELLSEDVRKISGEFFHTVIANMYGAEEMNCIAYECPYHNMHVLSENVYVECLTDNGCQDYGGGEIVVTNLINYTMPLIRYVLGDSIILSKKTKCICGYSDPFINVINGRTRLYAQVKEGEINEFILCDCISQINIIFNYPIVKYHFMYYKKANILFCEMMIKDVNVINVIEKEFIKILRKYIGDCTIIKIKYIENDGYVNLKCKSNILDIVE